MHYPNPLILLSRERCSSPLKSPYNFCSLFLDTPTGLSCAGHSKSECSTPGGVPWKQIRWGKSSPSTCWPYYFQCSPVFWAASTHCWPISNFTSNVHCLMMKDVESIMLVLMSFFVIKLSCFEKTNKQQSLSLIFYYWCLPDVPQ